MALAFAAVQVTVATFWPRALGETTLAQLHRDWAYRFHVYQAILLDRHKSMLVVACVSATFVAVDGPILQRASTVVLAIPNENVTLTMSITPELPTCSVG